MPAIYQPLKPLGLLKRLGYAEGRFILEDGRCFLSCTLDWSERELHKVREEDAKAISEEEITQVLAAARSAGMAASMSVIRERVSRLAADMPPDRDTDGWIMTFCSKPDCLPFPHGARFKKGNRERSGVHTFEDALGLCFAAVGRDMMTPDQAVLLLHGVSELPVDVEDFERLLKEAIPEEQRQQESERQRSQWIADNLGAILLDPESARSRITVISARLPPEIAAILSERFGRDD